MANKLSKIAFVIFMVFLYSSAYSAGEVNETGKTGLSFLRIPTSARTSALGGASSAFPYGSESAWANPALLAPLPSRAAQFTHTEWIGETNIGSASISMPFLGGGIGAGLILFNSGDMDLYGENPTEGPIGTFAMRNMAFNLGYSYRIMENLSIGAAYKIIYEDHFTETASGFAVDAGLYYTAPVEGLYFGAALRNAGRMGRLLQERTSLPTDFVIGARYLGIYGAERNYYNILLDINYPRYGPAEVRAGFEISPIERFFLRMGWRSGSELETVSFGFGLIIEGFIADIAYTPMRKGFEDTIRLTLGIRGF